MVTRGRLPVLSTLCALTLVSLAFGKDDPVQWTLSSAGQAPASKVYLELKAAIQPGWHLYSPTTPPGGPIITKIQLADNPAVASYQLFRPQPVRKLDPNFQIDTETYATEAAFLFEITAANAASSATSVTANVRYQACTEVKCLPPVKKSVSADVSFSPGAAASNFTMPAGYVLVPAVTAAPPPTTPASSNTPAVSQEGLLPFLLTAFGFGLAAIFTPCVFPMIPITVSFFLNQGSRDETAAPRQNGPKQNAWIQALVFCAGIVVLFTGLGFLVTAVAGPFGVVQLGSSPWINSFIALVFFVFALSLLGAFELRLPSGLLTKLDRASQGGGFAGTLLMGLTFSLTSFACIGPIVGPLLIASVQSKGSQPVLGMFAFATGLAAPFFALALFPSYLKKLPRSGGWMIRVKIVLGFLILAVMLKYLSNVDQVLQTHWLTRERFLAAWIVLFALPGIYLLGLLPMEGMKKDQQLGVGRALLASLFIIFSVSLIPGLFGASMGDLDAFVPEGKGLAFGSSVQASDRPASFFKNDLDGALAAARQQNKLVLVNFTGYACTNCHWMKANMFPRPEIQTAMKDMIIVDLFTDGTDADSEKNQKLEDTKFGTASIPFYALLDVDQNTIATFPQLTRDTKEFLGFLQKRPIVKGAASAMLR